MIIRLKYQNDKQTDTIVLQICNILHIRMTKIILTVLVFVWRKATTLNRARILQPQKTFVAIHRKLFLSIGKTK